MQLYKVRISLAVRADMVELRKFLKAMMTEEGAVRYARGTEGVSPSVFVYTSNIYSKNE
jgi:hypothetical protein